MSVLSVALLALLASANLSAAQNLPQARSATPEQAASGLIAQRLVASVFPESIVKQRALDNFRTVLREQLSRDPGYAAREARFPGVHAAGIGAGSSVLSGIIAKLYLDIANSMSAGFANGLTTTELNRAETFYSSATGQKVLSLKKASFDAEAVAARLRQKGSPTVDMKDIDTPESWRRGLSVAEAVELDLFSRSPTAAKVDLIISKAQEEYVRRFNGGLAANSMLIDRAVTDAINNYMARSKAAGSRR